jgi:uncharacterized coiled-coil protein SlyX
MAINSENRHEQNDRSVKRDRYWSVMLVGDHGRIIPFRRFKGIAISVIGGLVLAVLVIAGLTIAYLLQASTIDELEAAVEESTRQIAKLRNEKDLLLTKLVINNKHQTAEKEKRADPSIPGSPAGKENQTLAAKAVPKPEKQSVAAAAKPSQEPKPASKKEKPAVPVQFNADVRRFNIEYQSQRNLLKCNFRLYNTSKPKKALAGRSVVVFKNMDDPPIKWLAVPRVQLADGVPNGKHGKFFKINNYMTMKFKAYGLKPPVRFTAASIYVYTSKGSLLLNREVPINIDIPAPPPRKPAPAPSKPTPDRPATAPGSQPQPATTPAKPAGPSTTPPEPSGTKSLEPSSIESDQDPSTESTRPDSAKPPPVPTPTRQPSEGMPAQSTDGNASESLTEQPPNPSGEPKTQGE